MLHAENISLAYNQQLLFENINFYLNQGELLAIHGPNGAGKTSLLKILTGLIIPSAGCVYWERHNIALSSFYLNHMGFIGHLAGLKNELSVSDNLNYLLAMDGTPFKADLLSQMSLAELEHQPVAHLSFGQKRRLLLARMLHSSKKIWILDEPLAGVDRQGIELVENILSHHIQNGGMAVLTSHQPFSIKAKKCLQLELVVSNLF